jgi:hypothetical protein
MRLAGRRTRHERNKVTAAELASEIYKDTCHFSFSAKALKHRLWPELKAMGDAALPDLFTMLKDRPCAHVMTMIAGVASEQVAIPESERGYIKAMVERYMTWGRYMGFTR